MSQYGLHFKTNISEIAPTSTKFSTSTVIPGTELCKDWAVGKAIYVSIRKLEKAVAVKNSLLKSFPADFDAAGGFFTDFPATRNAIPAKVGHFPPRKMAAGKSAPPSGTPPLRPPQPS